MAEIGTNIKIQIGGKDFIGETSNTVNHTSNMIETSSKASGRGSTYEYGRKNITISVSSLNDPANTTDYGYKDAVTAMDAKTKVTFQIGPGFTAGNEVEEGTALISSVSQEAPDDDNLTFSVELQVDGVTSFTTIV